MAQTELQQSLIEAMSAIAASGDNSLSFDRTIECEVISIKNAVTGEYKVRYLNGEFSAYDTTLKMSYKVGATVFVKVPQNDMSLKKIIDGAKSTNASDLVNVVQDNERVDKVGIPFEQIYSSIQTGIDNGSFGVYGSILSGGYSEELFTNENNSNADEELQFYAKDQTIFMISAKFKTSWYSDKVTNGDFGILVIFEDEEGNDLHFVLDRSNLYGNPMKYTIYTQAYALLKIDGNKIKKLKKISLFAKDFKRTDYTDEADLVRLYNNGSNPEITIKDLSIQFVKEIDTSGYNLNITAPRGTYFGNNYDTLQLSAVLKYQGKTEGIDTNKVKYYWFARNALISTSNELFDEIGGVGWYRLKDLTTATVDIRLNHEYFALMQSQEYKVVVIYEENKVSSSILLRRNRNEDIYSLSLEKYADRTGKIMVNAASPIPAGTSYFWTSTDVNGLTVTESDTNIVDGGQSLLIDIGSIIDAKTFYCTLFSDSVDENNIKYPLATLSIIVSNIITTKDFTVDFLTENNGLFTYDENGDYNLDNLIKNIDFNIVWKNEADAEGFSYEWILPKDLTKCLFSISEESNLIGTSATVNHSLSYSIKSRFDYSKSENNIIKLKISIAGIEYFFSKILTFTKEGDPGTNGTSLIMKVDPFINNDNPIYALLNTSGSSIQYKITLYYNGTDTFDGQAVNSYFDLEASIPRDYQKYNPFYDDSTNTELVNFSIVGNILTITTKQNLTYKDNAAYQVNSIVQLKASPHFGTSFNYNVFNVFGVPTTNSDTLKTYYVNGTKNILYDEKGYNPKFANTPYLFQSDKYSNSNYSTIGFGAGASLSSENILTPVDLYNNGYYFGIIFQLADISQYYIQPITFSMNAYSQGLLNAWDGASLEINEDESYVLAAQIGAGHKDADNKFTGVLMGELYDGTSNSPKETGLLGFAKGQSSFGFLNDGSAYIGILDPETKRGARIEFSTSTGNAIIQSAGYSKFENTNTSLITSNEYIKTDLDLEDYQNSNLTLYINGTVIDTPITVSLNNNYPFTSTSSAINLLLKEETIQTDITTIIYKDTADVAGTIKKRVVTNVKTSVKELQNGNYVVSSSTKSSEETSNAEDGSTIGVSTKTTIEGTQNVLFISTIASQGIQIIHYSSEDGKNWKPSGYSANTYTVTLINMASSGSGMLINLTTGSIDAADLKLKSSTIEINSVANSNKSNYAIAVGGNSFYIRHDGTGKIGGWNITNTTLSAGKSYLNSDGTIVGADISGGKIHGNDITGGTIDGTTITGSEVSTTYLFANYGVIGGWNINASGLYNKNSELSSNGDLIMTGRIILGSDIMPTVIDGNEITTEKLSIQQSAEINWATGTLKPAKTLGTLGLVEGNDGTQTTDNIGIETTTTEQSIILKSARNIALRAETNSTMGGHIYIEAKAIHFTEGADLQGVYAKFKA